MSNSITANKAITVAVLSLGLFYLLAPKETLDQYAPDSLVGYPQTQCTRQTIGAVLIVSAIFLNNQRSFKVVNTPSILPGSGTEKFFEDYSNFPDYETFVI